MMFADTVKMAPPFGETMQVFEVANRQTGKFGKMTFVEMKSGLAIYHAEFEKGEINVSFSLDENGQTDIPRIKLDPNSDPEQ